MEEEEFYKALKAISICIILVLFIFIVLIKLAPLPRDDCDCTAYISQLHDEAGLLHMQLKEANEIICDLKGGYDRVISCCLDDNCEEEYYYPNSPMR